MYSKVATGEFGFIGRVGWKILKSWGRNIHPVNYRHPIERTNSLAFLHCILWKKRRERWWGEWWNSVCGKSHLKKKLCRPFFSQEFFISFSQFSVPLSIQTGGKKQFFTAAPAAQIVSLVHVFKATQIYNKWTPFNGVSQQIDSS